MNISMLRFLAALALLVGAFLPAAAHATAHLFGYSPYGNQQLILQGAGGEELTLDATSMGWWDSAGFHNPDNTNYCVCVFSPSNSNNAFFAFDISGINFTVISARLSIGNPEGGFFSDTGNPFELVSFFDVFTDFARLSGLGDGENYLDVFEDLASGTLFGTHQSTIADDGTQVLVGLNASFLFSLNQAIAGGLNHFAVGATLMPLEPGEIPEPAPFALLLFGAFLVRFIRRSAA